MIIEPHCIGSYNCWISSEDEAGEIPHEAKERDCNDRAEEWNDCGWVHQRSRHQDEHLPSECQDDH